MNLKFSSYWVELLVLSFDPKITSREVPGKICKIPEILHFHEKVTCFMFKTVEAYLHLCRGASARNSKCVNEPVQRCAKVRVNPRPVTRTVRKRVCRAPGDTDEDGVSRTAER